MPEDWAPRETTLAQFRAQGWDPTHCVEVFKDHWAASAQRNSLKIDWEAAFRNWVREDIARGRGRPYAAPREAPAAEAPMDVQDPLVAEQIDLFLRELNAESGRQKAARRVADEAGNVVNRQRALAAAKRA